MRILVTGASSAIGRRVCIQATGRGHEVVRFARKASDGDVTFQLGARLRPGDLAGADAVLHLAWDWAAPPNSYLRVNVDGSRRLLDSCAEAGALPVLLSTFTAFSQSRSQYGDAKRALEFDFQSAGGGAVRAGLIWGESLSGMVATVAKLARISKGCPHLVPDPVVFHSEVGSLSGALIDYLAARPSDTPVKLGAHDAPVRLSEISHAVRASTAGPHVRIPVALVRGTARTFESVGVSLPFRADSLAGGLAPGDVGRSSIGDRFIQGFPDSREFLGWLRNPSHRVGAW